RSITVGRSGSYSLTVTDGDGCRGASDPVTVQTLPAPARPIISRSGDVLTSSRAHGYQWLRNHVPIPGATDQFYQLTELGTYAVQISDSNGCTAESLPLQVSVLDVGKLPTAIHALDLYPNPANGSVTLFLRLHAQGRVLVELHDMLGRRVLQRRLHVDATGIREVLQLDALQPGMYFVRVTTAGSHVVRPLLLSRQ
ncbi:MAG: T9SS type A sorting domain-containing protein, partial [Bacteroidota bacterium]|nr:T9SS type A sorting domain-containing protein [Bacteroidota bacterium]